MSLHTFQMPLQKFVFYSSQMAFRLLTLFLRHKIVWIRICFGQFCKVFGFECGTVFCVCLSKQNENEIQSKKEKKHVEHVT